MISHSRRNHIGRFFFLHSSQNANGSAYSAYSFTPPAPLLSLQPSTIKLSSFYTISHGTVCFRSPRREGWRCRGGSTGYLKNFAKTKSVVRFGPVMSSDHPLALALAALGIGVQHHSHPTLPSAIQHAQDPHKIFAQRKCSTCPATFSSCISSHDWWWPQSRQMRFV